VRRRLGFELVIVGLFVAMGAVAWDLSYVAGMPVPAEPHDDTVIMAHNTAATIVLILGVILAAIGARMLLLGKPASRQAYLLFATSTLMFADGVLHFFVVSEHLAIVPFAVFFVAAGAAQIGLGFGLFKPRPFVYLVSAVLTVGLIGLFFLSRTVTLPYAEGPEEYEFLGLVSKVLEFATIAALGILLYRWRVHVRAGAETPPAA
jgi:hypothetical protein